MPNKQKLSPWHDGSVKPVHVGVYEVNRGFFSYWDGEIFNGHWSRTGAMENKTFGRLHPKGCYDTTKWRGIVK